MSENETNDDTDAGFGIIPRYLRGTLTAHEIAVYVALTWRANKGGVCWLRHRRLAEEAGCSVSTARRALNSMHDRGLVTWTPKYGEDGEVQCNIYTLRIWPPGHDGRRGRSSGTEGASTRDNRTRNPERDPVNDMGASAGSTRAPTVRDTDRLANLADLLVDADCNEHPDVVWEHMLEDGIKHPYRFAATRAELGELSGYLASRDWA